MTTKKLKAVMPRVWAVMPIATNRNWAVMEVFRDKQLAADYALAKPHLHEIIEFEFRPIKKRTSK